VTLRAEQVSSAIFLIGLGLLWMTGWWFPGILFVIGASIMATALVNHHPWTSATGALWMFGLGTIFWLHLPWAFIFVLIGISMFSSSQCKNEVFGEKSKNDYKYKKDDDYDIV
jgi:hypothetical protein